MLAPTGRSFTCPNAVRTLILPSTSNTPSWKFIPLEQSGSHRDRTPEVLFSVLETLWGSAQAVASGR